MPIYRGRGVDAQGQQGYRYCRADDVAEAYALWHRQGFYVLRIQMEPPVLTRLKERMERFGAEDMAFFLKRLVFSLRSGIPILQALQDMRAEHSKRAMLLLLDDLEQGLLQGMPLSEALTQTRIRTPLALTDWVRIGEEQGRLDDMMEEAANALEEQHRHRQQLMSQLAYPLLVVALMFGVLLLMTLVVIPILGQTYQDLGTEQPLFLTMLLALASFFSGPLGWLMAAAVLLFMLLWYMRLKRRGVSLAIPIAKTMRRMPLLKRLLEWYYYTMFARALGGMLKAGITLPDALQLLEKNHHARFYTAELAQAMRALQRGSSVATALSSCSFVPPLARTLIDTGERTGRLSEAFLHTAQYYDDALKREQALVVKMIEPIAIILLGVIVLVIALGLLLPILDSYQLYLH